MKYDEENKFNTAIRIPLGIKQYGFIEKKVDVMVMSWDIPDMIYTSICKSNDYRNGHMTEENMGYVINLYRGYENEKTHSLNLNDASLEGIFSYLMGMSYEQFTFQNPAWTLQNFNRNYHILIASDKINRENIIDINEIVKEQFEMQIYELLMNELIILWLYSEYPNPLSVPEEYFQGKVSGNVTKEKIKKIVEFYSVDYQEVRSSKLKKQIFYKNPFVRTEKKKQILLVSFQLLLMSFADGLYWLERNYYLDNQLGQDFLNAFGNMFEDYFRELAETYLSREMWDKIPEGKEKSADFYIEFNDAILLFELKSGTLGIGAKQQIPEMLQIDKFYSRNIIEAYEQLNASERIFRKKGKPVIKFFLPYEFTNNTEIMMGSLPDIFEKDIFTYILTISDLEMFLATYKNDRLKVQNIITDLITVKSTSERESFLYLLNKHGAIGNLHFTGERDYFNKILRKLSVD